ncbi:MAG: NAD(P)/FAD-dependent oxidoreductase [Candidatus Sigynarchaeota archaeon]
MDVEVAIIGAGPGGMQAAIELGQAGVDCVLVDPRPGVPEAPGGIVTIPRRSHIFGQGHCGQPDGAPDWAEMAESPLHDMLMAGRRIIGKMHWDEIIGYNFTRGVFWKLMLDEVKRRRVSIIEASATALTREADGISIETTGEHVKAKAVIYAAGVRGNTDIAKNLGLGVPPTVHGIFGDFQYDGEWKSPELGFLFNLDLVTGYFWCAYARKTKRVSIGIMNEKCLAPKELIRRFANTGIIPEIKDKVPDDLLIQEGHLGVVPHLRESTWPVTRTAPRVIAIGEATGQIGAYIYEGLFAARYEGKAAAKVITGIKKDDAWGDASRFKRYEAEVKVLDDYFFKMSRMQHYAMYHGGTNGQIALEAYLKAFNQQEKIVSDAMLSQYIEFSDTRRFELGLFGAIIAHVPFFDKLAVTASLVTARMQK